MASKSSAKNVAASSVEGNKEGITQLENPSSAGPSGVKAKDIPRIVKFKSRAADNLKESSKIREGHVNVGFENESGSSDSGSQVHNQPEKNGSSDSTFEVNLTDPADSIKAAHEAAISARYAAASCRKTLNDSSKVIKFCNKRFDSSARKARAAAGDRNASRYRSLAQNYQRAAERVELLISEAESAAELAEVSAYSADNSATSLAEVIDTEPEAVENRQQLATAATNIANSAASSAYNRQYLLLKGMKESCQDIDSTEIRRAELTVSFSDERKCIKICTIVFAFISAVVGSAFFIVSQVTKLSKPTYDALIASGSLTLVASSVILTYRFVRYFYKKRQANERKRRREMAASIETDLRILKDYFKKRGMTAPPGLTESPGEDEL